MNYNPNSGYGLAESVRLHLGLPVMGKVLVVAPSTDANYDRLSDIVKVDPDGKVRLYTTLKTAYDDATTNANDVILISANSGHAVPTAGLLVTKNRIHFLGMDGGGRHYGSRSRITAAATVTATGAVVNTGVGNTFRNLKFDSASVVTASRYAFSEGGEYSLFVNCEFYKSTDLDDTLAAELLLNGDSPEFKDCTFGSNANIVANAKIRPCVQLKREVITGKVCRDAYFENCLFWRNAGGNENTFVDATGTTDVERMLMFKDCTFFATELSAAQPDEAVTCSGGKQTEGLIFLKNCSAVNCALMAETAVGIWIDGAVPTVATSGLAVE